MAVSLEDLFALLLYKKNYPTDLTLTRTSRNYFYSYKTPHLGLDAHQTITHTACCRIKRTKKKKNETNDATTAKKTWTIEQTDRLTRIKVTRVQPNSNDNVQISDNDPDLSSDPDDTDEDSVFDINNERTKQAKAFNFDIGKGCKKIKKAYLGT
ncbi:hypothetical protein J6590_020451 [Homalodisca vitripennis]|nr:hypothetical protein J6590_020451 [Homalodisca vitripennis]